jgi:hypothetical protein
MLSEAPAAGPAPYDPENCHACPAWNGRAGRCRTAAGQRTCGSNELEVRARAAAGRRVTYDLFAAEPWRWSAVDYRATFLPPGS